MPSRETVTAHSFPQNSVQSHLLDDFDAQRFQTLLQDARGQGAQGEAGIARGFVVGLEHGTVFVERGELAGQLEEIVAKIIRAQFLGHGFQCETEVEQMLGQREFFGGKQVDS